jgi:membrane protein
MMANANKGKTGIIATIIGLVTLLLGASGVFGQLKSALNTIWEVEEKKEGGVLRMVKDRFLSFTMVLGVGFLLLVSLVVSAALSVMGRFMERTLPLGESVWHVVNLIVSFGVITVIFAVLFKYLPDREVAWRHVWTGAVFTALLFVVGKFGIGMYLGKSAIGSTFGTAASLAIILVWLYYSGMIFFFGAEFTEVRARMAENGESFPVRARKRESFSSGRTPESETKPRAAPLPVPQPVYRENAKQTKSSKGALAGVGVAGVVVGAVAGTVGAVVVLLKGVRKLLRV